MDKIEGGRNVSPTNKTEGDHCLSQGSTQHYQELSQSRLSILARREYLAGAGLCGIVATTGCLGLFRSADEEASDTDDDVDEDAQDDGTASDAETDADETNAGADDDTGNVDGDDSDENRTEEDEDELYPDEEDTEIDRDQYDEPEQREITERDSGDVEIEGKRADVDLETGVTVTATVTNVSSEPIDAVDLVIEFYDVDDAYLGTDRTGVEDLDVGESKEFEGGIAADELRGDPERVEITPTVYDIVAANEDTDD